MRVETTIKIITEPIMEITDDAKEVFEREKEEMKEALISEVYEKLLDKDERFKNTVKVDIQLIA